MEQLPLIPDTNSPEEKKEEIQASLSSNQQETASVSPEKEKRLYEVLLSFQSKRDEAKQKSITQREISSLYRDLSNQENSKTEHVTPKELQSYLERQGISTVPEEITRNGWSTSKVIRPKSSFDTLPTPRTPPTQSFKDKAAGDDTFED